MQSIRNCPECERIFAYDGKRNLCPRCIEKEEQKYQKVRQYVKENPGASITEVSEMTEVDEELVLRFLKEGRLHSKGLATANITSECARCGKKILSGRYCQDCLMKMTKELNKAVGADKEQPKEEEPKRKDRDRWHLDRS